MEKELNELKDEMFDGFVFVLKSMFEVEMLEKFRNEKYFTPELINQIWNGEVFQSLLESSENGGKLECMMKNLVEENEDNFRGYFEDYETCIENKGDMN